MYALLPSKGRLLTNDLSDFSPAASNFRTESIKQKESKEEEDEGEELTLTPSLLEAFQATLQTYNITLHFISGPWSHFPSLYSNKQLKGFDLILTSETIYQPESYKDLIEILKLGRSSRRYKDSESALPLHSAGDSKPLESTFTSLSLHSSDSSSSRRPSALIASKILYFGVGGSIDQFSALVRSEGGTMEEVWRNDGGVGRGIWSVSW